MKGKWLRRKRGTKKQIGKPFPILEKKKLPHRISILRKNALTRKDYNLLVNAGYQLEPYKDLCNKDRDDYTEMLNTAKRMLGEKIKMIVGRKGKYIAVPARAEQIARMMAKKPVRNISYHAPEEGLYDGSISFVYDGDVIRNEVKLVEHDPSVASFDKHDPVVYVHRKIPEQYRKHVAIHESVEKYLKEKHGLNEYAEGHRAADEVEKKLMSLQDWARYTNIVKRIHNEELASLASPRMSGHISAPKKIRSARLR